MTYSFKYLTPALIALSLFASVPGHAGAYKNGAGDHVEIVKPPSTPTPPSHDKNGESPAPPSQPNNRASDNSREMGAANITCVVNGRVYRVRSVSECYVHPQYGSYQPRVPAYRVKPKKNRRAAVAGGLSFGGGYSYGGGYGGGYVYAPQPIIRYYQPASPAAIMQAQKRARRAQAFSYSGGYALQDGYGYGQQGYGYGGGYAVQGGYDYGQGYVAPRKKNRKVRSNAPIYMPNYSYDPGYTIHYGPTIAKDGGY